MFDRRIAKEVDTSSPFDRSDAAIERYVYDDIHNSLASLDGGNVVLDFVDSDGAGTQPMVLAKRYLYGQTVDQILAQEDVTRNLSATDRVLWPLVDNLGTVRDLAKQDGTIAAHYEYDSYGNVTSGDTSLTRYLFTSRALDTDTGLQYNRARWYDADVGRWVSEDPIGFLAGDGNVARYVGNWTVNATDTSGLDRGIRFFFGHMWIEVDSYDNTGKKTGTVELHFSWFSGYSVDRPGDSYPRWGYMFYHTSNSQQDEALIELWRELECLRREGGHWLGYTGADNCNVPAMMFVDYGGGYGEPIMTKTGLGGRRAAANVDESMGDFDSIAARAAAGATSRHEDAAGSRSRGRGHADPEPPAYK